jgi:anthraniloyl-CoA monooxygenase
MRKPVLIVALAAAPNAIFGQQSEQLARGKAVYDYWCATCHAEGDRYPGTAALGVKELLALLQARCRALGVDLRFEHERSDDLEPLVAAEHPDLIIAADGLNSRIRERFADTFRPDVDTRLCRYIWLGTPRAFDAFTFAFRETPHGWFQAHAYQFTGGADAMSTFIVETPQDVWDRAGLDRMIGEEAIAFCEQLFAPELAGAPLRSNASHLRGSAQWIRFPRVTCNEWVHWVSDGER